ncbi:centrosomal protein of 164 kDa-like isoform X2 [Paramacrobiotus metropolitanus]|uniref:centrosomal protein of 164 kDa-like isoform X2 n=1 Tax=Paramacrobiotus metropolitanus TaxID=2943436 RepID=UPI0024459580|nr:centrosomal protein of 164 kDa-like isoform X2 [Paramacrobiotus metropolitanus]
MPAATELFPIFPLIAAVWIGTVRLLWHLLDCTILHLTTGSMRLLRLEEEQCDPLQQQAAAAFPCWTKMKSARPQILLLEDVAAVQATEAPTDDDIAEYARALGINVKDEVDLVWIAREGLNASLPPGWRAVEDQPTGQIYYFNTENGVSAWEHPLDTHFRQMVERERQNRLRRRCVEEVPPELLLANGDTLPPRQASPYSHFRTSSPVSPTTPGSPTGSGPPRNALRPRAVFAPPPRSPAGAGSGGNVPPWARPATPPAPTTPTPLRPLSATTSPSPTASPTPSASPGESRRSLLNLNSSDTSSPPFNRPASPNAPPVPPKPQVTPEQMSALEKRRASESFPQNDMALGERRPSSGSAAVVGQLSPAAASTPPPVAAKPSVERISAEKVREEEARIRRENEETIRKMRERLRLEREAEEKKLREQMNEEIRLMKDKIAKEREGKEKDLRNEIAGELKRVNDNLQKERASQEKTVREAMNDELRRLRDQLKAEKASQEQLLRDTLREELQKTEEALRKEELDRRIEAEKRERAELEQLKKSMEAEINSLQEIHRRRVEEIRQKHAQELKQVEQELDKMNRELDKIKMEAADEAFFKKAQIDALEKQKGVLESQIQDLRKQENEVKQQCDQLKEELRMLAKDLKQSQMTLERLERQRTDMEEDMSFLQRAKQRYLERVDQLKTVVEEHLGPIAEGSGEALTDAAGLPADALTNETEPLDLSESTLMANGPVFADEPAHSGVPVGVDLDDPISGFALPTARPRSPQRERSPYSSIIRRHSSHRSLSPRSNSSSQATGNGRRDIRAVTSGHVVNVRNLLRELLIDEASFFVALYLCPTNTVHCLATPTNLINLYKCGMNVVINTDGSGQQRLSDCPPPAAGCHWSAVMLSPSRPPSPSATGSPLTMKQPPNRPLLPLAPAPSPSSDCDPEKIDRKVIPLRRPDACQLVCHDPGSYILQNQLDAFKLWIAKRTY